MKLPLFEINRHGVYQAPLSLWICVAFLLRHWVLMLIILFSWLMPADTVTWVFGLLSWNMLLAESPLLLLVLAGARRVAQGGAWARVLWRRGRELMSLTAVLNIGCAALVLAAEEVWNPVPERVIALFALFDAAILVAVWRSEHFRAVFADFPSPSAATAPRQ